MQPSPTISITQGTTDHLDACVQILLLSKLGQMYFTEPEKALKVLRDGVARQKVMVAFSHEACVGFYWWDPKGTFRLFPYLHLIVVKQGLRGQGLGTLLLDHFEQQAFTGASKVFLAVADFNPRAKKLYERQGYVEVGAIPGLYKPGVSEYIMMKAREKD